MTDGGREPSGAITVVEQTGGRRLDVLVAEALGVSRTKAGELVSSGTVLVEGRARSKSYRVAAGEVVEVGVPEASEPPRPPPDVEIVWSDEHVLVVDKPAGLVVHAAPSLDEATMVDALLAKTTLAQLPHPDRPGVVHRLDRDVSGLLVVARTDEAYQGLARDMAARHIGRHYLALVLGEPPVDSGKIDAPIGRHPRHRTRMAVLPDGRPAVTWFTVLERLEGAALCEVRLQTGRTHQIRTHLASIGHPVVGDAAYGRDPSLARRLGLARPFLHACRLAFTHPVTGEAVEVSSDLPPDLAAVLYTLRG